MARWLAMVMPLAICVSMWPVKQSLGSRITPNHLICACGVSTALSRRICGGWERGGLCFSSIDWLLVLSKAAPYLLPQARLLGGRCWSWSVTSSTDGLAVEKATSSMEHSDIQYMQFSFLLLPLFKACTTCENSPFPAGPRGESFIFACQNDPWERVSPGEPSLLPAVPAGGTSGNPDLPGLILTPTLQYNTYDPHPEPTKAPLPRPRAACKTPDPWFRASCCHSPYWCT